MKVPTLQVAAKALILNEKGQTLVLREAAQHKANTQVGRYQLHGGRLEPGESFEDGLKREVFEETGLRVAATSPVLVGEWRPIILGVLHQIVGIFMACNAAPGPIRLSEEHDAYQWIDPANYKLDIVQPDCEAVDLYGKKAA
jgi:8-oxo-dGTP diphosphatase